MYKDRDASSDAPGMHRSMDRPSPSGAVVVFRHELGQFF